MIITERLIIRPPIIGDAQPLNDAINRSLPELTRWMPWALDPSLKPTEDFIYKGVHQWENEGQTEFPMIVALKSNKQIIGASGFNEKSQPSVPMFEIGYWIDTQFSGKGYMTEAVNAISQYAFDKLNANRVQICTQRDNIKSAAVAARCGFIKEAVLKNYRLDLATNNPCDEVIYACLSKKQLSFLTPITIE